MTRALLVLGFFTAVGCGYTKEEYQLQGDKLTRAEAKLRSADVRADEAVAELEVAKEQLGDLEKKVRLLGLDITPETKPTELAATIAERERALTEHRARLAKLGEVRARVAILRQKVAPLVEAGVAIVVRDNHVLFEVSGDALFDANKDKLKPGAKDVLDALAAIMKEEPSLTGRRYQVIGHVDDKASKSRAAALTLSLGRASAVLAFLTDEKGAALDRERFGVAGLGAEKPIVNEASDDARKRNRRIEIALVPAAGEHIDLRALMEIPSKSTPTLPPSPKDPVKPAPAPPTTAPAPAKPEPAPKK